MSTKLGQSHVCHCAASALLFLTAGLLGGECGKLWHVFAYLLLPFSSSPARKGQRKYQGKANDQVNIVV